MKKSEAKSIGPQTPITDPEQHYRPHPSAEHLPLMSSDQLVALAKDIEKHGLLQPIMRYRGLILDGRNRFMACGMTEKPRREPLYVEWNGECGTPTAYVLAANDHGRRHLTTQQRVFTAVAALPALRAEAAERQKKADPSAAKSGTGSSEPIRASDLAARAVSVSADTIERAEKIQKSGNKALIAAVQNDELAITDAAAALADPEALTKALQPVLKAVRAHKAALAARIEGKPVAEIPKVEGPRTLMAWIREHKAAASASGESAPATLKLPAVVDSERAREAVAALKGLGRPEVSEFAAHPGFVVVTFRAGETTP